MAVQLNVSSEESRGWLVVSPSGEIDIATADELDDALSENRDTVLDLSGVTFMDSTGLRTLVAVHNRLQEAGVRFRVVVPSGPVQRIIEITGLSGALDLVGTRAAALTS